MRGTASTTRAPRERTLPRRSFLGGAAAVATVGAAGVVPSIISVPEAVAAAGSFVPSDQDLHLLRRATYGATPSTLAEIRRLGADAWVERQLDAATVKDAFCDDLIAERFPRLAWSITKAWTQLDSGSWDVMFDLGVATLARAAWSKRQLLETMVDFWSNHLNVTNPSSDVWASRHDYDTNVIRAHALGKFSDMLAACATHAAMMFYLNNAESTKDSPNENYGRELLELHTVGVGAGYSEDDMRNSALVMTGFGVDWDTGGFAYHGWDHFTGHVQVMGWSDPNGSESAGFDVGRSYVDYLAHHPSTATHIATKLCQRFISDAPAAGIVDQLAQVYLDNDTAIAPVLRTLFRSHAFASSIGQKIRRPMEDVVATVRILGMRPDRSGTEGLQGLYWMIEGLGNVPMGWHPPNGYPDVADAWRSAGGTLGRWNAHTSLAAHWWPEALGLPKLRSNLLPKRLPATYAGLIDTLAERLVFRTLARPHRSAVLGFLGRSAGEHVAPDDDAVNWRLPFVVSLILDSPYHQVR